MRSNLRHAFAAILLLAAAHARAGGVTVYAAGDIARCPHPDTRFSGAADTAAIVAAGLASDPRAVVLTLGDHTYPKGLASEFSNCYGPTWGRFKDRTWPAPGNHEYYGSPDAAPYFAYFGARAGKGHYSFELAGWHIISLDSGLPPPRHAEQLAWLREDLARHPARCTLAYWHVPLYSSGGHGSIPKMRDAWELLYRAGVLRLSLLDGGYEWEFLPAGPPEPGARPDRGRGRCH